jgi:hypothetical protein
VSFARIVDYLAVLEVSNAATRYTVLREVHANLQSANEQHEDGRWTAQLSILKSVFCIAAVCGSSVLNSEVTGC